MASRKIVRRAIVWIGMLAGILVHSEGLFAGQNPLEISIRTEVGKRGQVAIFLTLTNHSRQPLTHLHPMLHFHHTMAALPKIHRLEPGETRTLENRKYPPVGIVGSYPVVAKVHFKNESGETNTLMHTDSFFFEEPMISEIQGRIGAEVERESSKVKILLQNPSPSFKNVRLMLLLPPELTAEGFQGMMGFTIRGGEEKYFEVPVRQISGNGGVYPIHLLVEYGEMLKHYSGEIQGEINFGPASGMVYWLPQLLVFVFIGFTLVRILRKRSQAPIPA